MIFTVLANMLHIKYVFEYRRQSLLYSPDGSTAYKRT